MPLGPFTPDFGPASPSRSRHLSDTTAWLSDPQRWDHNGGDGPFSDKRLARVQFTATLAEARRAGLVKNSQVLARAAARLAGDQAPDGSWPLEGEDEPGSPAAYGRFLATYLASESLRILDTAGQREPIARAGAGCSITTSRRSPTPR